MVESYAVCFKIDFFRKFILRYGHTISVDNSWLQERKSKNILKFFKNFLIEKFLLAEK